MIERFIYVQLKLIANHVCLSALQDKLLDYRMKAPCVPEVKDPDYCDENEMDEEVEGFASDFL